MVMLLTSKKVIYNIPELAWATMVYTVAYHLWHAKTNRNRSVLSWIVMGNGLR